MMKTAISIIVFFIGSLSFSQNEIEVLKLENEFKNSKNDTIKLSRLIKLLKLNVGSEKFNIYYDRAKSFSENLIAKNSEPSYTKGLNAKIDCEFYLADNFTKQNQYEKAISVLKNALLIDGAKNKTEHYSKILHGIATNYYQNNDFSNAKIYCEKNIVFSNTHKYKYGLACSYTVLHNLYSLTGDSKKKYEYAYKSIALFSELKDNYKLATAYLYLGRYYDIEGNLDKALIYYNKVLPLVVGKYPDLQSAIYNSLSYLYSSKKKINTAIIYANKALAISKNENDESGIANAKLMIGYLFVKQKDFNQANKNLNESFVMFNNLKAYQSSISALNIMGDNYYRLDSLQKANVKRIDVTVFPSFENTNLKTKNNLEIALKTLKYAENLNIKYGSFNEKKINYMCQKKVYLAMADYKNAFKMLELEKEFNDSIVTEENKKYGLEKELEYNYKSKVTKDSLQLIVHKKNNDLKIATVTATNYKLIIGIILLCSIGSIMYFRFSYIKKRKEVEIEEHKLFAEQKEKEIIETELNYLKSQINPHFLFNSLNTIFFKIAKTNDKARIAVMGFSEILRYQLYDCNLPKVPISKEIKYLQEYIRLQLMRKNDNCSCSFDVDPTISNFEIAPLILITFVENAFKYLRNDKHQNNEIKIVLKKNNNEFIFDIENDKNQIENNNLENSGIGLTNTKRRLDLIYLNNYKLLINNTSTKYSIQLIISI